MSVRPPSPRTLALHQELLSCRRQVGRVEHRMAALLATMHAEQGHRELGFSTIVDYGEQELALVRRKVEALLRLGQRLHDLPALGAAMAEGRLHWTKARELLKAGLLTPENEVAWTERAAGCTNRALEDQVVRALAGQMPPSHVGEPKKPARVRLVLEIDAVDADVIRSALKWERARAGVPREDADDGAILAAWAERAMAEAEPGTAPNAERYKIVVEHCPDCGRTEGVEAELTEDRIGQAACDAEIVELRPGPEQGHATHAIPPSVRRLVLHRDGYRCGVPGCGSNLWLDVHHVRSVACGGPSVVDNLICQCTPHHRMVHQGRLGIRAVGGDWEFHFPDDRVIRVPRDPRAVLPRGRGGGHGR